MNWDNHKDVMSAIHESSENLRFASDRIKDDKYFLLHILMSDWHRVYHDEGKFAGKYYPRDYRHSIWDAILQYASERLKDEDDFIDHVTDLNVDNFCYASDRLKSDKIYVIKILQKSRYRIENVLQYVDKSLLDDEEVVLAAVPNFYGNVIEFASDRLKGSKDFVLKVAKSGIYSFKWLGEGLRDDREFFFELIQHTPYALSSASDRLRDDCELVNAAVQSNGLSLGGASQRLRDTEEIVLAAIKNYENALSEASPRLKKSKEFVLAAAKISQRSLCHCSPGLRGVITKAQNALNMTDELVTLEYLVQKERSAHEEKMLRKEVAPKRMKESMKKIAKMAKAL